MLRSFLLACLTAWAMPVLAAKAPPPPVFADAERAQVDAAAAGAADYAPMDLDFARDKLAKANFAYEKRDLKAAQRWAEQALVDAQLATVKSRAAKARAAIEQKRAENARIRIELAPQEDAQ
jgi:hypothetical protein